MYVAFHRHSRIWIALTAMSDRDFTLMMSRCPSARCVVGVVDAATQPGSGNTLSAPPAYANTVVSNPTTSNTTASGQRADV